MKAVPKCCDCKWFVPKTKMCRALSWTPEKPSVYRADLVRENIDLCGPEALYFSARTLYIFPTNLLDPKK